MAFSLRRKTPPFIVPFNPDEDEMRALRLVPPPPITLDESVAPPVRTVAPTVDDLGAPPIMISRNTKRRPLEAIGGEDDIQRDTALYDAQAAYKAPRSTKDFLLRLATGFIRGGLPGAAAQGLSYELDPQVRNQDAVGDDMALTRGRLQRNLAERSARNALLNDASRRQFEDARTQELLSRGPKVESDWFPVDTDNDGIPDTEVRRPLTLGATRQMFPKARAEREPLLKTRQNPDGSTDTLMSADLGKTWTVVPDLTSHPPPKPDDIDPSGSIQAARDEQAKIDAGLAQIAEQLKSTPPLVDGYPNPAYEELNRRAAQGTARRQHLDDQIRGWSMKLRRGSSKSLDPVLEQRIRTAAKSKGLDPDIAVQRALARQ